MNNYKKPLENFSLFYLKVKTSFNSQVGICTEMATLHRKLSWNWNTPHLHNKCKFTSMKSLLIDF